jgi:hypothetical protein
MGRGQQAQVQQNAQNMLGTENANAATTGNAATAGYLAEQANPGYTGAEKTAITGATEGGLGAAFGAAQEGAANTAARTNNAAGLTASNDALARQRMITSGNLADTNATNFANARIAGTNTANAGLGGLYGTNVSGANATLGHQTQNAAQPGFWDSLLMKQVGAADSAAASGAFG